MPPIPEALPEEIKPPPAPAEGDAIIGEPATDAVTSVITTHQEDMEVHHESHIHHKKRWRDYLFEFFMLFLAVSSGFFVENLREHYVEHERAKEYAAMLRTDLVADTTIMNIIASFRIEQKKKFDSLRTLMLQVPYDKINQADFLRLAESVGQYLHLIGNNGTLQQLKSSGSLRYFTDTTLVYALTSYEEDLKHGEYVQGEEKQHCADRVLPFKFRHFNMVPQQDAFGAVQNFPTEKLVDLDKKELMEFYNLFDKCSWYNEVLTGSFPRHKKKATFIINRLIEEYGLD